MGKSVAVVYHYAAHYRQPLFERLFDGSSVRQTENCYWLFSDFVSNVSSIKVIDPSHSGVHGGNWRWVRVNNVWLPGGLLWQKGLVSRVLCGKFNVVIILGDVHFISSWVLAACARFRGQKVLMWTHGVKFRESGLRSWVRLRFYSLADELMLYGYRARQFLAEMGLSSKPMHVIYNSLDYGSQRAARESLDRERMKGYVRSLFEAPVLGVLVYCGRLIGKKNIGFLISGIELLKRGGMDVGLLIVGDGPDMSAIENSVERLGVASNVVFAGACYREEQLGRYFLGSDAAIIPSAAGLSVLHAMAYGLPVIADDNYREHGPEVEAISPGVTGAFYRSNELDSFAEVVTRWFRPRCDEDISRGCIDAIEKRYTPDVQVQLIESVVNGILR